MSTRLTNPTTSSELEYTHEELEFLRAIDRYKRDNHRPHPTWREVLRVFKSLGWRKVEEQSDLPKYIHQLNGHTSGAVEGCNETFMPRHKGASGAVNRRRTG